LKRNDAGNNPRAEDVNRVLLNSGDLARAKVKVAAPVDKTGLFGAQF